MSGPRPKSDPQAEGLEASRSVTSGPSGRRSQPADIADRFESRIKSGGCPSIDEYVADAEDPVDREFLKKKLAELLDEHMSQPGVRLEHYEIGRRLGGGGMGVVHLARDTSPSNPREVALKRIQGALIGRDPKIIRRFRLEFAIASELNIPNVVPVYEIGCVGDVHYYTMKYIDGRDLDAWALELADEGDRPSFRRVAELLHAISIAVHRVHHDWGVIHRDIKPSNILIEYGTDVPWIVDFGLARRLGDGGGLTASGGVVGTPIYMAPEQLSSDLGGVGPSTDIYGLGAVLYCLITGGPPVPKGPEVDVYNQVIRGQIALPRTRNPSVPHHLEAICLKCLERNPRDRYTTVEELAADLKRWLDGHPTIARRTGVVERVARSVRRRPEAAVRIGMALLAIAAFGTAYSFYTINTTLLATNLELTKAEQRNAEKSEDIESTFAQARKAIEPILGLDGEISDLPGNARIREKLGAAALAYSDVVEDLANLADDRGARLGYKGFGAELAAVMERSMKWLAEKGKTKEALERGEKALKTYRELDQADPNHVAAQARILNRKGWILKEDKDPVGAREAYEKAAELLEKVSDHNQPIIRVTKADNEFRLGELHLYSLPPQDLVKAGVNLERSSKILMSLSTDLGDDQEELQTADELSLLGEQARVLGYLGDLETVRARSEASESAEKHFDQAESHYTESSRLREALLKEVPLSPDRQFQSARGHLNFARLNVSRADVAILSAISADLDGQHLNRIQNETREYLTNSVDICNEVIKMQLNTIYYNPGISVYYEDLGWTYLQKCRIQIRLASHEDAMESIRVATEAFRDGFTAEGTYSTLRGIAWSLRSRAGIALADPNADSQSKALAREWLNEALGHLNSKNSNTKTLERPDDLIEKACVQALLRPGDPEAVDTLARAVASPSFSDHYALRFDPDLESVRKLPKFRDVLAQSVEHRGQSTK